VNLVGSIGAEYSEESEPFSLPIKQSITGKAVLTGKPFYDLEADKLSEDQLGILGGMGIRTIICIPILSKNVTFGAITLADTRRRRGLEAFIKTLEVIANHLAQELERLRAWDALSKAKEEWEHTFDAVPDLVCILDKEFRIVRLNLSMAKKLGMQPADCIGKTCYEVVHGAGTPPAFCPHAQLLHDGEEHTVEIYEERLGGYFIITTSPIYDEKGQLIGGVHMARDITEKKLIENQVKASLAEKEVLLREIHHRVKNNMQIISSLLKLSTDSVKDDAILKIFTESQGRIKAMALIHEKLYQSADLTKIDFSEYIESLSHELYRAYGIDPDRITMRLSMESIAVGIETAIPCGLVVNELFANALKHAFPGEIAGEIEVLLSQMADGLIELTISDNGVGIPSSVDLETTQTLGLYIVNILVKDQLEGSVTLDRTKGTTFRITFRRKDKNTK
jgi:PAS domain S-box-containing protein